MCVIAIIEEDGHRPTDDQIRQMHTANSFGGGAAWRDTNKRSQKIVRYKKGLSLDDMLEMNRTLSAPYVLHFRVPSSDTSMSPLACHPFVLDDTATTKMEGTSTSGVLFHNGYWGEWRTKVQNLAVSGFIRVPVGEWSDSRALAWTADKLGLGILQMINEKVVVLTPDDVQIFGNIRTAAYEEPSKWNMIETGKDTASGEVHGFWVSNTTWVRRGNNFSQPSHTPHSAVHGMVGGGKSGGTSQQSSFRETHGSAGAAQGRGQDYPKALPEAGGGSASRVPPVGSSIQGTVVGASITETPDPLRCVVCQTRKLQGVSHRGAWHCYQCWSTAAQVETPNRRGSTSSLTKLCSSCKTAVTASRRYDNDEPLCAACAGSMPSVRVYYVGDADRIQKERDAEVEAAGKISVLTH